MKISIYGTRTSAQQFVLSTIRGYVQKARLDYEIVEVCDINTFIEKDIEAVPAIQCDDGPIIPLKHNSPLNGTLRRVIKDILSLDNYGNLTKILTLVDFSEPAYHSLIYSHRLATQMDAVLKAVYIDSTPSIDQPHSSIEKFTAFVNQIDVEWNGDMMASSLIAPEYREGSWESEVKSSIKENKAKLVVTPFPMESSTHDTTDLLQGILHSINCPLLFVPKKANFKRIENVLLICDNNHLENIWLVKLLELVQSLNAKLIVALSESDKCSELGAKIKQIVSPVHMVLLENRVVENFNQIISICDTHHIDIIATHVRSIERTISSFYEFDIAHPLPLLVLS